MCTVAAKHGALIVTRFSPQLNQFSESKDVVTIENMIIDQSEPPHQYHLPSDLNHNCASNGGYPQVNPILYNLENLMSKNS